jgi:CheY-like chemotaxis protein
MGIPFLVLAIIIFIIADYFIRLQLKKSKENAKRKEREAILNANINIDYSMESKTLKRVEVDNPAARILAVDDEEIILDSFRKILVLDGYSVDTVETGQEALGLIQKNQYDFVFTDLKMPQMGGVEVCKGVKQLRPDIDVIVITGYASVDTAVETMKFGAMDYIQKPFTEDELLSHVKEFVIRRNDSITNQLTHAIKIVHKPEQLEIKSDDFSIPGGVFIANNHTWLSVTQSGLIAVGVDDFAYKTLGGIEKVVLPVIGQNLLKGDALFSVTQGDKTVTFQTPVTGKVSEINTKLNENLVNDYFTPYYDNWVCKIEATGNEEVFEKHKIGNAAIELYQNDIKELNNKGKKDLSAFNSLSELDGDKFDKLTHRFFSLK